MKQAILFLANSICRPFGYLTFCAVMGVQCAASLRAQVIEPDAQSTRREPDIRLLSQTSGDRAQQVKRAREALGLVLDTSRDATEVDKRSGGQKSIVGSSLLVSVPQSCGNGGPSYKLESRGPNPEQQNGGGDVRHREIEKELARVCADLAAVRGGSQSPPKEGAIEVLEREERRLRQCLELPDGDAQGASKSTDGNGQQTDREYAEAKNRTPAAGEEVGSQRSAIPGAITPTYRLAQPVQIHRAPASHIAPQNQHTTRVPSAQSARPNQGAQSAAPSELETIFPEVEVTQQPRTIRP